MSIKHAIIILKIHKILLENQDKKDKKFYETLIRKTTTQPQEIKDVFRG